MSAKLLIAKGPHELFFFWAISLFFVHVPTAFFVHLNHAFRRVVTLHGRAVLPITLKFLAQGPKKSDKQKRWIFNANLSVYGCVYIYSISKYGLIHSVFTTGGEWFFDFLFFLFRNEKGKHIIVIITIHECSYHQKIISMFDLPLFCQTHDVFLLFLFCVATATVLNNKWKKIESNFLTYQIYTLLGSSGKFVLFYHIKLHITHGRIRNNQKDNHKL